MARLISKETLQQTIKCTLSFQCLDDERRDICSVELSLREKGCFLKTVKPIACRYRVSFGDSYLCTCPTRLELFNKYKI
jgi:hypothetical protein